MQARLRQKSDEVAHMGGGEGSGTSQSSEGYFSKPESGCTLYQPSFVRLYVGNPLRVPRASGSPTARTGFPGAARSHKGRLKEDIMRL